MLPIFRYVSFLGIEIHWLLDRILLEKYQNKKVINHVNQLNVKATIYSVIDCKTKWYDLTCNQEDIVLRDGK